MYRGFDSPYTALAEYNEDFKVFPEIYSENAKAKE